MSLSFLAISANLDFHPMLSPRFFFTYLLSASLFFTPAAAANSNELVISKGPAELRVCTQNLNNLGIASRHKSRQERKKQIKHLIERILNSKCDVVAVQEVGGKTKKEARYHLRGLARELSKKAAREFKAIVGETLDKNIRNGFLLAQDTAVLLNKKSYARRNLPKLQPLGPDRRFSRGPLLLWLRVPGKAAAPSRDVLLATLHFKSKANSWKDPTKTQFETLRIEMAEGLRRIIEREHGSRKPKPIVVIMGDRNSAAGSASASVLSGSLEINDFFPPRSCRVNAQLRPDCVEHRPSSAEYLDLFSEPSASNAALANKGTYRYKGKESFLDMILLSTEDAEVVQNARGEYSIGIEGRYGKGSDHKMLWAELNW